MSGAFMTYGGIETTMPGVGGVLGRIRPRVAADSGAGTPAGPQTNESGRGRMTEAAHAEGGPSVMVALFGFLALAVVLWVARKNSSHLQGSALGINAFNVVAIGVLASIWILFSKVIFNKLPVPGLTPAINAI